MAVFRVEKTRDYTVMSNHHLRNKDLSLKAKGLLSLMLSLPENWDYTLCGLAAICKDGLSSIRAAVLELENCGYLRRRRIRNEKGQLTETEYTILEQPEKPEDTPSPPICDFPTLDNPTLGKPTQAKPTLGKRTQLNTESSKTDLSKKEKSNTHISNIQSINPGSGLESIGSILRQTLPMDTIDGSDMANSYRCFIKGNIEYDIMVQRYERERLDELVELMVETVLSKREYIRIASDDFPREVVKSRLLKLNSMHVEYVFDCIDKNTTKVHNIKAYLLTALYNAPVTMGSYYKAEVNHDFGGRY